MRTWLLSFLAVGAVACGSASTTQGLPDANDAADTQVAADTVDGSGDGSADMAADLVVDTSPPPDAPDSAPIDTASADVLPDAAAADGMGDCLASADVGAPQCSGGGALYFPSFSKACSADSDCIVAEHQINCCGTKVAWGLAASEKCAFDSAEAVCESQYPGCGCAQFMTQAEDGYTSFNAQDFAARCTTGQCRSYVKDALPECSPSGLQAPKPVKACNVDTDCDFSITFVDCCGSLLFTGIAKFAKPAYDIVQKKCQDTAAVCKCMPKPTILDDGKELTTSAVPVACVSGSCRTGVSP